MAHTFLSYSGPTIIYISSKKRCLELAKLIYEAGFLTGIYHGDLSYQERQTVQQQFLNNDIPIIVATSAFGMGINKKISELSFTFIYLQVLPIIYKKLVAQEEMVNRVKPLVCINPMIVSFRNLIVCRYDD